MSAATLYRGARRATVLMMLSVLAPASRAAPDLAAQPLSAPAAAFVRTNAPVQQDPDPSDDMRWRIDRCLLGMGYHSVGRMSVGAAGGLRRAWDARSVCLHGAAHVGLGAVRTSLGSAVTLGRFASAVGLSGGALRTFGRPGGDATPWRNYVGGSVHVWPLLGLHTEVGRYRRVARGGEEPLWLTTWGVGFGY